MGELQTLEKERIRCRPPLVLQWNHCDKPRMLTAVRVHARTENGEFGPTDRSAIEPVKRAFNFTDHIRRLSGDIIRRCPELAHVRLDEVFCGFTQARNNRSHGLQARVTPLRFRGGALVRRHRGVDYQVQRFILDGREVLYLIAFCLPRFLNQSFEDKLVTLFHELFHISPRFDGDLRRHAGRYAVHSHSQRRYDQYMAKLARAYLRTDPDPALLQFLRLSFAQLRLRHGSVVGVKLPRPKLVPLLPDIC